MEDSANDKLSFDSESIGQDSLDDSVLRKLASELQMLNKCHVLSTINYSVRNEENALAHVTSKLNLEVCDSNIIS